MVKKRARRKIKPKKISKSKKSRGKKRKIKKVYPKIKKRKLKRISRGEKLKLQVESPKPFERTPDAAGILILVAAIILFVQGILLMFLAFFPIGILSLLRVQLILSLGKISMVVFGLVWVFLGVIILLIDQSIKATRKLVWDILLLIISVIIFLTGRIIPGILIFVAAVMYIATRKSVYKRKKTRIVKKVR